MRKIHLANEKKRDAEIGFMPGKSEEPVTYVLADGRKHSGARLLKSTLETEPDALAKAHPDLAAAIEQGDRRWRERERATRSFGKRHVVSRLSRRASRWG